MQSHEARPWWCSGEKQTNRTRFFAANGIESRKSELFSMQTFVKLMAKNGCFILVGNES